MNPLPYDRQRWAFARIVTASTFSLGAGPWTVQPMVNSRRKGYGFELIDLTRVCLPAIGEATFQYRFGLIDGDLVGIESTESTTRRVAGSPWDQAVDAATAPDLRGHEVRIQLAPPEAQGVTPSWRTVWWGQVEYQSDTMWPGSAYPAGVRTYRCVDGFARAKRWPLNRHSTYAGSYWYANVEGHPGYNLGEDGRISGNRDTNNISSLPATEQGANLAIKELIDIADTGYKLHCLQGIAGALTWSVQQALEDAMRKTRGIGDAVFSFSGSTSLIGDAIAIPVRGGDTAWDLVARHCRRERGRGNVFVDWTDDVNDPTGKLVVKLTILPQTIDDIVVTTPGLAASTAAAVVTAQVALDADPGNAVLIAALAAAVAAVTAAASGVTLPGAVTAGSTVTVDLIGDHRVLADETQLGDRFLHVADAVETTSELVQLLVTLSYFDGTDQSLSQRWLAARESIFAALAATNRTDEAWLPMWNLHGLPPGWDGTAKDHNGGTAYACDFALNDSGGLITSQTAGVKITSPILCRILPDLPISEGYDYTTSSPKRKTGDQTMFDEAGRPARRAPIVWLRTAANTYLTGNEVADPGRRLNVKVRGRDVMVYASDDENSGLRIVGNKATLGLGSRYNLSQLGVTIGLELPHAVRRRDLRAGVAVPRRTVIVRVPDLHLWLAHSGALWDVDAPTRTSLGCQPLRGAGGGAAAIPGVLRDDRDALSRIHAMACAWYLSPRQTGKWVIRACGLLPSFETTNGAVYPATPGVSTITYPTLGAVVTDFKASGQITKFNTPITMVHYDHATGRTTWETDWQELDTTA